MMIEQTSSIMKSAFSGFDQAGQAFLTAVSAGGEGAPEAIGAMIEAKTQFRAGIAVVKLEDEMMRALLAVVANDP